MPNERVRYFKPRKDLLGFDSASNHVFQYNLYKMQKCGLSENFILMDDDYFIAKLLKKVIFYEEKGKILLALITSDYYEMNKEAIQKLIIF